MILNESKKKRLIIQGMVFLSCLIISCLLCIFAIMSPNDPIESIYYDECAMPKNSTSVLDEVTFSTVNSEIIGHNVYTRGGDAQLYMFFDPAKGYTIQSFSIVLEESYPYEVLCTLFYPDENGQFDTRMRSSEVHLPAGKNQIYISIPKGNYNSLRLDIDNDYSIKDIIISEDLCSSSYSIKNHLDIKKIIICFFILMCCFEVLYAYKDSVVKKCKKMLLNRDRLINIFACALAVIISTLVLYEVLHLRLGIQKYAFWIVAIDLVGLLCYIQIRMIKKNRSNNSLRNHSYIVRCATFGIVVVIIFGLIGFTWYECCRQVPARMSMMELHFIFIFLIIETIVLAFLYYNRLLPKDSMQESYVDVFSFTILIIGIMYMLVFLPFVSPDEFVHYTISYRYSNFWLGKIGLVGDKRLLMRVEDYLFYTNSSKKLCYEYYTRIIDNFTLFANHPGEMIVTSAFPTSGPFSYVFSGLGISIGRLLNLSGILTYYLGRTFNLVFFVLSVRYAMRKMPFGQTALFVVSMFPMTLQLGSTYSYDLPTYCFIALFVSQVMYIAYSKKHVNNKDIKLCMLFAILLAPSKMVFIPLLFITLIIPQKRIGKNKKEAYMKKAIIILAGLLSMLAISVLFRYINVDTNVSKMINDDNNIHLIPWAHEEGYTISWIIGHLGETVLLFIRTLINNANAYFYQMIGSFLGWLDVYVPYVYTAFCFIIFLFAVNIREYSDQTIQVKMIDKLWIAVLCIGSMAASMLALLLDWTPLSSTTISGVQGRYFLPLLIPAIIQISNNSIVISSYAKKHIVLIITSINIWVCVYIYWNSIML